MGKQVFFPVFDAFFIVANDLGYKTHQNKHQYDTLL
jgi:hypothetical protein